MGATSISTNGAEPKGTYRIPDHQDLGAAGELMIKDVSGNQVPLKSLYTGKGANERQLVVFIRHFFCGACEDYVRALAKDFPPSKLAETSTTLTLIGCGDPVCIPDYKKRTECPFEIYADPSRKIYSKLGMVSTFTGGISKGDYMQKSILSMVLSSTRNALSKPSQTLKSGTAAQNGGEWLFQGGELKWCHRMSNAFDHAEMKELGDVLATH